MSDVLIKSHWKKIIRFLTTWEFLSCGVGFRILVLQQKTATVDVKKQPGGSDEKALHCFAMKNDGIRGRCHYLFWNLYLVLHGWCVFAICFCNICSRVFCKTIWRLKDHSSRFFRNSNVSTEPAGFCEGEKSWRFLFRRDPFSSCLFISRGRQQHECCSNEGCIGAMHTAFRSSFI